MILEEQKDLKLYKRLLNTLYEYDDKFPTTGVTDLLNNVMKNKMKSIPEDSRAQDILKFVLYNGNLPFIVNSLLNLRFSDLPKSLHPIYTKDKEIRVAFWFAGEKFDDKVVTLISGKTGYWCDETGTKVQLVGA